MQQRLLSFGLSSPLHLAPPVQVEGTAAACQRDNTQHEQDDRQCGQQQQGGPAVGAEVGDVLLMGHQIHLAYLAAVQIHRGGAQLLAVFHGGRHALGHNACTNSPGCLVAAKLYQRYEDGNYLSDAKKLYEYVVNNSYNADGRVEEPPLTYTQGTFGEACRQLYHITQESKYMDKAKQVINYAATSDRCLRNGILRDEGSSMDQSIFKSVYIPYAVNLALDEASGSIGKHLITFLKNNAETLRMNLNHAAYPAMYCNYWWGEMWKSSEPASMGAQVSGASLMEGIARLE